MNERNVMCIKALNDRHLIFPLKIKRWKPSQIRIRKLKSNRSPQQNRIFFLFPFPSFLCESQREFEWGASQSSSTIQLDPVVANGQGRRAPFQPHSKREREKKKKTKGGCFRETKPRKNHLEKLSGHLASTLSASLLKGVPRESLYNKTDRPSCLLSNSYAARIPFLFLLFLYKIYRYSILHFSTTINL